MAIRYVLTEDEFIAFCVKVEKLRAEGLSDSIIASRVGVSRTTIVQRMKRYRETKHVA